MTAQRIYSNLEVTKVIHVKSIIDLYQRQTINFMIIDLLQGYAYLKQVLTPLVYFLDKSGSR